MKGQAGPLTWPIAPPLVPKVTPPASRAPRSPEPLQHAHFLLLTAPPSHQDSTVFRPTLFRSRPLSLLEATWSPQALTSPPQLESRLTCDSLSWRSWNT